MATCGFSHIYTGDESDFKQCLSKKMAIKTLGPALKSGLVMLPEKHTCVTTNLQGIFWPK